MCERCLELTTDSVGVLSPGFTLIRESLPLKTRFRAVVAVPRPLGHVRSARLGRRCAEIGVWDGTRVAIADDNSDACGGPRSLGVSRWILACVTEGSLFNLLYLFVTWWCRGRDGCECNNVAGDFAASAPRDPRCRSTWKSRTIAPGRWCIRDSLDGTPLCR